ncbi:hypothetical protein B0H11DRAFT_2289006 [Mycena galericulata]|nr:hypothetical protein B0H11DRAFT_2289006 [Mycena galericulata]
MHSTFSRPGVHLKCLHSPFNLLLCHPFIPSSFTIMARILFALVSMICMFQTLAAPLDRRAVTSKACSAANVGAIGGIESARVALGPINTAFDIGSARLLLQAQLSLLDANNGTTEISDSLLTGAPPAPADANTRIIAGLQAAQGFLNQVFDFNPNTTAAVKAANASITTALTSAQQGVSLNCTTTAS